MEENYKEKLMSIRDKYNNSPLTAPAPRGNEMLYPLSQQMDYSSHPKRTYDHLISESSPVRKERPHYERPKVELKCERAYSRDRLRNADEMAPMSVHQMTEAHLKRQDNFNHFISDLDKRIEDKEKKLCDKFRENEKIIRHFEDVPEEIEHKRLQRFGSTRQFRGTASIPRTPYTPTPYRAQLDTPERSRLEVMPRTAYEKSLSYRPSVENVENQLPIRNYMVAHKARDQTKKRYPAHDLGHDIIQKKLEGHPSMGKDGWNTTKLEHIQNRIQSVLRQVNK